MILVAKQTLSGRFLRISNIAYGCRQLLELVQDFLLDQVTSSPQS